MPFYFFNAKQATGMPCYGKRGLYLHYAVSALTTISLSPLNSEAASLILLCNSTSLDSLTVLWRCFWFIVVFVWMWQARFVSNSLVVGIWRDMWLVGQIRGGSLPGYKHSASTINGPTLNQLSRQKPVFMFINSGLSFVWIQFPGWRHWRRRIWSTD